MLNRRECMLGSVGAGIAVLGGCATAPATDPIRAVLQQNVGAPDLAGAVAIVVDRSGAVMAAHGTSGVPGVVLDGDTVFEIGSITKMLTALMLADMAARGEVALDDPVTKYLPPAATLHEVGRPITLLDLATYTSGLPNMPGDLPANWWASPNPFAGYTTSNLYAFLSGYTPKYEPGAHYEYANIGFGLLGQALARRAGKSYEELFIERIADPLGLGHTRITLTADMQRRIAQGREYREMKPAQLWDMPAWQGAGALRSTAKDMTQVLKACMGFKRTPLSGAFSTLLETRRRTSLAGTDVALGWWISSNQGEEIVWKGGATSGFNSFIGYSTRSRRGALVLQNGPWHPMTVGMKLINPEFRPSGNPDSLY